MWSSGNEQIKRGFRNQFERDRDRILFRKSGRGRPVIVTEQEMEESVATYLRRVRLLIIAGVVLMIGAILTLVLLDGGELLDRDGTIWLLIALWLIPLMAGFWWVWRSPTALFKRRVPVGAERSSLEVRRKMLAERSWMELLGLAAGMASSAP